jgi:hypothetical protein
LRIFDRFCSYCSRTCNTKPAESRLPAKKPAPHAPETAEIGHGPLGTQTEQIAEKVVQIASCGRGSESAARKISRMPSRDHRERSFQRFFSNL